MDRMLLFGAGKIGRSFIAQLFSRGGYHVIFVDIDKNLVNEINNSGAYNLIHRSRESETIRIENISALHFSEKEKLAKELDSINLLAVSVGKDGFNPVMEQIGELLKKQILTHPGRKYDILLAENIRNAAAVAEESLVRAGIAKEDIEKNIGLIETSIGKMVPLQEKPGSAPGSLDIIAEPYNELILDKDAFLNEVPSVDGLNPVDRMEAWVDRKLFIHNLGHASLAYFSYSLNPDLVYTWEALDSEEISRKTKQTMIEAAEILLHMHPGAFTRKELNGHIDDLLSRFANQELGVTVYRVGCDLNRKLGPDDRFVPAMKFAAENGLRFQCLLEALICGLNFQSTDINGNALEPDVQFREKYAGKIPEFLQDHCKFDPVKHSEVFRLAKKNNYE